MGRNLHCGQRRLDVAEELGQRQAEGRGDDFDVAEGEIAAAALNAADVGAEIYPNVV
jgi:hypothetical protein